jgi:hypothetical protein
VKTIFNSMAILTAIAVLVEPAIARQDADVSAAPPPSAPPARSAADLEKLAAPMALYPDPLIAVMLPASAYPLEIVQAARFVADTNNLATLDDQPWDANVKAVARFPTVIQKMNDELSWTVELGQAFVDQPSELMDAIQSLRAKAQSVGTLQTTPEQVVIVTNSIVERTYETQVVYVTNTIVQIVPANPQVIYVPVYSPTIVYAPPPTYVYSPVSPLIVFSAGIVAGVIIANNRCDWHYGGVYYGSRTTVVWVGSGPRRYPYYPPPAYYRPPPYYPPPGYRPPPPGYRPPGIPPPAYYPPRPPDNSGTRPPPASTLPANSGGQRWQPDQTRLATTRAPSTQASINTMEARGWSSGAAATAPATRPAYGGGATTAPINNGTRPATVAPRPTQNVPTQPTPRPSYSAPSQTPNVNRPSQGSTPTPSQPINRPSQGGTPTPSQPVNRPSQGGTPTPSQPANRPSQGGTPTPSQPANRPSQSNGGQGSAFNGVSNGSSARDASNRGSASRGGGSGGGGGSAKGGRR